MADLPLPTDPARVAAHARFDPDAASVEIGGQVFDASDEPIVGADLIVRAPWGLECTTRSTSAGSFGVRFSAPVDAVGRRITIQSSDLVHQVGVI